MPLVSFSRLTTAGAVHATAFVTLDTVIASVANDLRAFKKDAVEGWREIGRHPFSEFGGTATGIEVLGCIPERSEYYENSRRSQRVSFLICAYGIRKIRFFRLSWPSSLNQDALYGEPCLASLTPSNNVDNLVLNAKAFQVEESESRGLKSHQENGGGNGELQQENTAITSRYALLIAFAYNYVDLCDLTLSSTSAKFAPVLRVQCSMQRLLYSLDLCVKKKEQCEGSCYEVEVAAGSVESLVRQ